MSQTHLFGDVAREWWKRHMLRGNRQYAAESWKRLELEVMPSLGAKPLKKLPLQ
jgi:hypothetical protein